MTPLASALPPRSTRPMASISSSSRSIRPSAAARARSTRSISARPPAGGAAAADRQHRQRSARLVVNHQGQFPSVTIVQSHAGSVDRHGGERGAAGRARAAPAADHPIRLRGHRARLSDGARRPGAADRRGTGRDLPRPRHALREQVHPITIISTLPSAGLGALLALMAGRHAARCDRHHRHHPADRHRQEERHHDGGFRARAPARRRAAQDAVHEACLLRFRPILMTTLCALLGGVPLMLGTGIGSNSPAAGLAIVGGLRYRRSSPCSRRRSSTSPSTGSAARSRAGERPPRAPMAPAE